MSEIKLPLIGRDRVLVDLFVKELMDKLWHPTRGPYEQPRGGAFEVRLCERSKKPHERTPTGHILRVTIEAVEFEDPTRPRPLTPIEHEARDIDDQDMARREGLADLAEIRREERNAGD